MDDTKTRALDMLSTAALDHYTPHMICVPKDKWIEAFAVAGSLEATPPADAACQHDTNGDGDCGRKTCAKCYPQYQPKPADALADALKEVEHTLWQNGFTRSAETVRSAAAALRARQAVVVPEVPGSFVEYMNKNYPAGTVIADAGWHARPIWNAACHAIQNAAILSATDSEVKK